MANHKHRRETGVLLEMESEQPFEAKESAPAPVETEWQRDFRLSKEKDQSRYLLKAAWLRNMLGIGEGDYVWSYSRLRIRRLFPDRLIIQGLIEKVA